ncbi:RraA family protein [Olivibacter sitiensis]|uniref:RraA family protein n=1 Tax=Olivibacter sitiensis TaxID=376470 RepID=UPI000424BCAC|nr:dimethylmenaquinone methyltransferase [Olivibacter sitiensis]
MSFQGTLIGQVLPKEELVFLTREWEGERFEDGRPKISDELLERAKHIGIDDAWTILRNFGYKNQFEGGWSKVHEDVAVVGRALTAAFVPNRPDLDTVIREKGKSLGFTGSTNSWPIERLSMGDVYVADGFGKIEGGTLIGQTLGNSIFHRSGNGVIFDGGARDIDGLSEIEGFNAYVRGFHPSFLEESLLLGLNAPIRIGRATVLPGDLVLAKREGVLFIPSHLAEKVIERAEFILLRDAYGDYAIKTGKFTTGEIDNQWSEAIKEDFLNWLRESRPEVKMTKEGLNKLMKDRTW